MIQNDKLLHKFQCYLIVGNLQLVEKETEKLAAQFNIKIDLASPDIILIAPQKASQFDKNRYISIDQIRQLKNRIFKKPFKAKYLLAIIKEANKLTAEAQNSLLKLLEEPPSHALIILEAAEKESLLKTIRSRLVIKEVFEKGKRSDSFPDIFFPKDTDIKKALLAINKIKDSHTWIDDQILSLYNNILIEIQKPQKCPAYDLTVKIEKLIETKKMINANVNPKFALTNMVLTFGIK